MKKWVLRERVSENLKDQLLFYRGIKTEEDAYKFLNPDYEKDLRDPFELLNMERAVERIIKAVRDNEKMIIFGDYDADGVSASAIFYHFFKKIGFDNFNVYIPDRHQDGYGLTKEAIKEFKKDNVSLIITLDCGITDVEEIELINNLGMEAIIIDHHLPPDLNGGKMPPAFAIVDPKQKEDLYPFKDFCGAGLAFKTVQAIINRGLEMGHFEVVPGWEKWLLDMVAIATIADMVSLLGENRILTYYGLKVLRKTRRVGLLALFNRLGLNPLTINEDDVSFMIAPRINITSRMSHANASFELLTTESFEEANWIVSRMEMLSVERKNAVEKILEEVDKKLERLDDLPSVIVFGNLNWNTGVLGLAASRLVEKYNRPVFLWGKERAKEIKGSCRSDGVINVVELMSLLPEDIFFDKGGHSFAGGFTLKEDKIDVFEKEIFSAFENIPKFHAENNLYIDAEVSIKDIDEEFYSAIEKFAPFGSDNPKPIFLFKNLEVFNKRVFGNGGLHLQLDFKKSENEIISAVGFFMKDLEKVKIGSKINLVATLEKSFFKTTPELRLKILDILPTKDL